ncbi:MAG: DUF6152 family protein [Burkholderiaceae bacterium]|nr:hypothetical protein [Rhodoferax sp.]MCP5260190.1 hypothetical protein [Rhodoferax sp.]MCW5643194.1 hypothetical protein [Rhodoferax sp.]
MQRRHILTGAGCALALAATHRNALAHHGWSSFDQNRPIYLAGKVKAVKWQNPHAEIVVTVTADAVLPANLASLSVPAQTSSVDGAKVLAAAQLPRRRGDWTIELSPMTRINAWKVPQPKAGDTVSAVAYTFPDEKGDMFARVEYLIIDGQLYGLRSNPA